jgi:archaellum component FlaC
MVTFPDAHLTCPNCNAVVPWSKACINCGQELPHQTQDPFQALRENIRAEENKERAAEELEAALPDPTPGEEPEGRLAQHMLHRVKALDMADRGMISHEVFTELYTELTEKTEKLMDRYTNIGEKVNEAAEILAETRNLVEEKQSQLERGDITDGEYAEEMDRLRNVIDKIQDNIARLKTQREELGIGGETQEDAAKLKELQTRLHNYRGYLPVMVSSDSIPKSMQGAVYRDLCQMVEIMDSSVEWEYVHDEPYQEPQREEKTATPEKEAGPEEDEVLKELVKHVKGHDDEIRRLLRAVRMKDNALLLGPQGEGKTETLLQLQRVMGGVYLHCTAEVTERELVAGFNPSAFVGENPVHNGVLMQIALNKDDAPIAYVDAVTKLRPRAQAALYEAMNNKSFTNPVDGNRVKLPDGFCVVAAADLDHVTVDTPDQGLLDRFGKTITWGRTPVESIQGLVARHALPAHVFDFITWIKLEVDKMRYLAPVSVRNLVKFAKEYHAYRDIYQSQDEVKQLAVDRLLKMRALNQFGLDEYEEARRRVMEYTWE